MQSFINVTSRYFCWLKVEKGAMILVKEIPSKWTMMYNEEENFIVILRGVSVKKKRKIKYFIF